jgi:hypothetical protein
MCFFETVKLGKLSRKPSYAFNIFMNRQTDKFFVALLYFLHKSKLFIYLNILTLFLFKTYFRLRSIQ